MISDLLDLADRLGIQTPRPFEPMPVHYVIDLTAKGKVLGITPAYGSFNEKSGEPELGKMMDCPAYFPLKIKTGTENQIQAAAGGGVSVAEAGHGDVREIFRTEIKTPKGKPPTISIIESPKPGQAETQEAEEELESENGDESSSEPEDDSDAEGKQGKNQYYRHAGWLKWINAFVESNPSLDVSNALKGFIDAKHRLENPEILSLFSLPDPANAEVIEGAADEKGKIRADSTKKRSAQLKQISGARFTFRINGQLLLKNREFRNWWASAYADDRNKVLLVLPMGVDGFSFQSDEDSRRLTPVFPHIPGVPGGGTYCPLASFDKAATRSFGLEKHTLSMSLRTAERAAAALKWLLQDKASHCKLGEKLVAVFWAVPPAKGAKPYPHDFADLLNEPDALQVLDFFNNIHGHAAAALDIPQFYCALLSSPKARITVRGWHTETLDRVGQRAKAYFDAITLPDIFQPGLRRTSPIGLLAAATVPAKSKSGPAPSIYSTLLHTALFGRPLPRSVLDSVLTRQSLELAKGRAEKERSEFESRLHARTSLAKLYFKTNKDITMNEHAHEIQDHPAYLCGRVLALMDKIHNAAHGKSTASSPAGRYYGAASSTPALVFPRLCKLARIHLDKIGGGLAYRLEHGVPKERSRTPLEADFDGLAALVAKFEAAKCWPRTLSLEEQGRFAIGFYYERCRQWPLYKEKSNPGGDETEPEDNSTGNETAKS